MTAIDRRTLVGALGAGLVLASCRPGPKDGCGKKDEGGMPDESGKLRESEPGDVVGSASGESELWGESVTQPRPPGVSHGTPFKPGYLCAAYIRFDQGGILVRQGHVRLTGTAVGSETEQGQIAQKLLTALKNPGSAAGVNVEFPSENFENFSFNGQQVVVLFVDNDPALARFVSAADMPPAKPGKPQENFLEHIVRFTQFSGVTLGEEVQKNYNFCALKPVSPALQGFDTPLAYRLNFWNRDDSGGPIKAQKDKPDTQYRYSMNIYLRYAAKLAGAGGASVSFPVILDPDGGNMGSNP
jgi:hypothetical protein